MSIRAEQEYERIRAEERAARDRREQQAYDRIPELRELAEQRRAIVAAVAGGTVSPAEALKRHAALTSRENELLESNGLSRDMLALRYRCDRCKDTGWLGSGLKKPCACRLLLEAKFDPRRAINDRETFAHFDEAIYPTADQREKSVILRDYCAAFAEALPSPEKPFLLILGTTGTGKSFFGNAIAYRALEKGIPALRTTAYEWMNGVMNDLRSEPKTRLDTAKAPLLVLDDLGSEASIPNVSDEALFALMDERLIRRRPTVIATNLSPSQLRERYGDRTFSRLTDKTAVQAFRIEGADLRRRVRPC